MSRQYLHKLLARYRDQGLDGLDARSRAPLNSPQTVTDSVRDRVVQVAAGSDCGRNGCRPDQLSSLAWRRSTSLLDHSVG